MKYSRFAKTVSVFSGRLLCNQADFAVTVSGDFRVALNKAAVHILPLNRNIRSELRRHRIILLPSGVRPSDLGLVKWVEQRCQMCYVS